MFSILESFAWIFVAAELFSEHLCNLRACVCVCVYSPTTKLIVC
jgi:hypothetical protein